ncbi:MAG: hypothetical protein WDN28_21175 [Chthoniobacter sp.]
METWQREFPALIREFRDADGVAPRHTFFYPIEQYDAEVLQRIADLCAGTGSETEIHLHHDNDTADNLRRTLMQGIERAGQSRAPFARRHWRSALWLRPRQLGAR